MCIRCWIDDGSPWEVTDRVRLALPLWDAADKFGDLHIVVEDDNLHDDHIRWCLERATDQADKILCEKLLEMSMGERWAVSLLSAYPGFDPDKGWNKTS